MCRKYLDIDMMSQNKIDWTNTEERLTFENDLNRYRKDKQKRSYCEKVAWFILVFILPLGLVVALYGPCAYFIVSLAIDKKNKEEIILLQKCMNGSELSASSKNCDPTELEYYDLQNYILINFYPYLTLFCQGTAFLMASLWHITDYRKWNPLGGIIAMLCLPVDILIFYLEPLGYVGTIVAMVFGFIPFLVVMADAAFPTKTMVVVSNGMEIKINRNSWTEDISLSYNQRYNFVARMTWKGWTAFSTIALCIPLFKSLAFYENVLGVVILVLEGIPQMISMSFVMIHWDTTFDQHGFELFESLIDLPLVVWYLSFYCSPETQNAVIGKLFFNKVSTFIGRYAEYIEKYIYVENGKMKKNKECPENETEGTHHIRCRLPAYDISKFTNVFLHHIVHIIFCPFVGIWECFNAFKSAFIRDFK